MPNNSNSQLSHYYHEQYLPKKKREKTEETLLGGIETRKIRWKQNSKRGLIDRSYWFIALLDVENA